MATGCERRTFGSLLKHYRLAAGLTHEALAERSGLSARTISDLERGISRRPRSETVTLLTEALHLSPAQTESLREAAKPKYEQEHGSTGVDSLARTLPVPLTSFVGRERETNRLRNLLRHPDRRLITLTGPAGVGKTRLAVQVAREMHNAFEDSARYVALAPVTDVDGVIQAILRAINSPETFGQNTHAALLEKLDHKEVLLLLDNFEHVLDAAPLLAELLQACPGLRLLVTSRSPLRLSFEQEFPVEPLGMPDAEHLSQPGKVGEYPAVALFVERAAQVSPTFELTRDNAATVAAICQRMDGLPLAVELAAAQMKMLSPIAFLKRLDDGSPQSRLELLTSGARDWPERHRTLRDAIAWSYEPLQLEEQQLFRWLSVFTGGWTLEAAETICRLTVPATAGHYPVAGEIFRLLTLLVNQSLVYQSISPDGEPRFGMLETIREFALEQLAAAGEEAAARQEHARFYLGLVETTGALLFATASKRNRTAAEQDNIQAALAWLVRHG